MFDTILVALDGSDHSRRAAAVAIDLAARYGARLVVAHVMAPGPVPGGLEHMVRVEHLAEQSPAESPANLAGLLGARRGDNLRDLEATHEAIGEVLTDAAERNAHAAGVKTVTKEILEGDPVEALLACVQRHGATMAVLGSRGVSDLKGLLLGSVSHKICQLAPCVCVTVK